MKLSVTAFILKATAAALREHPMVNAAISGDQIIYRGAVNLGCAVSVPDGLMVPSSRTPTTWAWRRHRAPRPAAARTRADDG